MENAYIFGAGASYSYSESPTGVRPPLASDFFQAYCKLNISADFDVRVGDIVSYVKDEYGIPYAKFCSLTEDAESFMTRLDSYVRELTAEFQADKPPLFSALLVNRVRAFDQMVFLFAHVLNEIQNGPICSTYVDFLKTLRAGDALITFNWDTLLDRALFETTTWNPDTGYGVEFNFVLDKDWRRQKTAPVSPHTYLKLHGSTNWFVNYSTWNLQTGERIMAADIPAEKGWTRLTIETMLLESFVSRRWTKPKMKSRGLGYIPVKEAKADMRKPYLLVNGKKRFGAYKNRYRDGYLPFSYFFPPNDPSGNVPLMPLIVPPTRYKLFEENANILDPLWVEATKVCQRANRVYLIGYSLPETDSRARELITTARESGAEIIVVNPHPEPIVSKLLKELGIPLERIKVEQCTFNQFVGKSDY